MSFCWSCATQATKKMAKLEWKISELDERVRETTHTFHNILGNNQRTILFDLNFRSEWAGNHSEKNLPAFGIHAKLLCFTFQWISNVIRFRFVVWSRLVYSFVILSFVLVWDISCDWWAFTKHNVWMHNGYDSMWNSYQHQSTIIGACFATIHFFFALYILSFDCVCMWHALFRSSF